MRYLNYHHLRIFYTVAREGSLARAAEKLHVTQPTLSTQLRELQEAMGQELFMRSGRRLMLTEEGRMALGYAHEIFNLGEEMMLAFAHGSEGVPRRLQVGIVDSVPKLVAKEVLRPAFHFDSALRVICREGNLTELAAMLTQHQLDMLLADQPLEGGQTGRTFNHSLGRSEILFMAVPELARRFRKSFPGSLDGAPMLLPTEQTPLRRRLEDWFHTHEVRPLAVAEFDDMALMKSLAADGLGIAPIHRVTAVEVEQRYGMKSLGEVKGLEASFYAITMERRIRHPAVAAVTEQARSRLFDRRSKGRATAKGQDSR